MVEKKEMNLGIEIVETMVDLLVAMMVEKMELD